MRKRIHIGVAGAAVVAVLVGGAAPRAESGGAAGTVEDSLDHAGDKTRDGVRRAGEATGEALDKVITKTGEGVGMVIEKTGEGLNKAGDALSGSDDDRHDHHIEEEDLPE